MGHCQERKGISFQFSKSKDRNEAVCRVPLDSNSLGMCVSLSVQQPGERQASARPQTDLKPKCPATVVTPSEKSAKYTKCPGQMESHSAFALFSCGPGACSPPGWWPSECRMARSSDAGPRVRGATPGGRQGLGRSPALLPAPPPPAALSQIQKDPRAQTDGTSPEPLVCSLAPLSLGGPHIPRLGPVGSVAWLPAKGQQTSAHSLL